MGKKLWVVGISLLLLAIANSCSDKSTKPKEPVVKPYFGQELPGETPVAFAPEKLDSLSIWVEATAFSPDGNWFFLSVGASDYSGSTLYYSKIENHAWTPFAPAPFAADFVYANEPVFSADGATLIFTGNRAIGTHDLWTVPLTDSGWGEPTALPAPINSNRNEYRCSYMTDGTIYFCSARAYGMLQIYRAYLDSTQTLVAEMLPAPINTHSYEGDPCIAPDGHFLVFYSCRGGASSDLFVSFKDSTDQWQTPINLGPEFNTSSDEYGAHLSSDGQYLFFTRHTAEGNRIYWVAISAIEGLDS